MNSVVTNEMMLQRRRVSRSAATQATGISNEAIAVLEAAPDASIIINQSGTIIWTNSKANSLLKLEVADLSGEPVSSILTGMDAPIAPFDLQSGIDEFSRTPKLVARRPDGSMLPLEVSFSPLHLHGMQCTWLSLREPYARESWSLIDAGLGATDHELKIKKLNEELEQRILELESFSYSVSHDLRAPLRGIDGFIGIFLSRYLNVVDEEGKRLLGNVRRNVDKMGSLIDELLALSRVGMKDIQITTIDMFELVNTVLEELNESKGHCSVVIKRLEPAQGDVALIKQVLVNLVSNAFKYSAKKEKPLIEIGCYPDEDETQYYIRDNGVGFDMEYSNKLFGVFQRLHDPQEYQGTGVGLAIVKRIINRHDGSVWAVGKENEGATFYFSLKTVTDAKQNSSRRIVG
jgi:signal transduction histidine kinase